MRHVPIPLALIVMVALVEGLAWAFVLPAAQGPDEQDHFDYVQRMVEERSLPGPAVEDRGGSPTSSEAAMALRLAGLKPLQGNIEARPAWTPLDEKRWERATQALARDSRADATGPSSTFKNPPLYYVWASVPYVAASSGSYFDQSFAMRLANLPLFLGIVILTWLLAGELLGRRRWLQALAAAVVALHPVLAHTVMAINPEVLLTLLWTAFLYLAVLAVKRGPSVPLLLGIGAACALAEITHGRGLPIVVGGVAAVVAALWRHRPIARAQWVAAASAVGLMAVGGALFAVTTATTGEQASDGGGPENRVSGAHGDASVAAADPSFNVRQFASYVWQFYLPRLPFMQQAIGPDWRWDQAFSERFWGIFAGFEVAFSRSILDAFEWLSIGGLIALAIAFGLRRTEVAGHLPLLAVLVLSAAGLLVGLHVAAYSAMLQDPTDGVLTGRYLFPLIGLFGVAVSFIASALPRRPAAAVAGIAIGVGVLLQLGALGLTATRFYA